MFSWGALLSKRARAPTAPPLGRAGPGYEQTEVTPGGLFDLIQRDAASSPTFVRAVVGKRISRIRLQEGY
jgi:hypothetical protein